MAYQFHLKVLHLLSAQLKMSLFGYNKVITRVQRSREEKNKSKRVVETGKQWSSVKRSE